MATYNISMTKGTGISGFYYGYYDSSYTWRSGLYASATTTTIAVYSGTDVYVYGVTFKSGYTYPVTCGSWTMYTAGGVANDPYIRSNANRSLTISATAASTATTYKLNVTCDGCSINYYVSTTGSTGTLSDGVSKTFDFGTTRGYIQLTSVTPSSGYTHPVAGSATTGTTSWSVTNSSGTILDNTIYSYSGGGVRYVTLSATEQLYYTYYGRLYLDANGGNFYGTSNTYVYWPTSGNLSNTGTSGALVSTNMPSSTSQYVPYRDGYTFVGWATSSTATTAEKYSGDSVSFTAKSTSSGSPTTIIYYAVWKQLFTLSYTTTLSGVSNMPSSSSVVSGGAILVSTIVPVKDGYTFLGWAETASGSVKYTGSESITMTADKTLYAVFEKITLTLFYWNGSDTADAALIAKGEPVSNITAARWNSLLAKISELSDVCGVDFSYTAVSSGQDITATRFNVARTGINNIKTELGTATVLPDAQVKGYTVYASLFTGNGSLKSALNHLIGVYNSG